MPEPQILSGWRIRTAAFIGIALAVFLLSSGLFIHAHRHSDGLTVPGGEMLGGDFICFYTAGRILRSDAARLYDYQLQEQLQAEIKAPANAKTLFLPFVYPPLFALPLALIAGFSLQQAFFLWTGLSAALFLAAVLILYRVLPLSRAGLTLLVIGALGYQPFIMECLAGGQTSCAGLLVFTLVYAAMKAGRERTAGVFLSLSYYKPPLFVFFILAMLVKRRWRLLAAFAAAGLVLTAISAMAIGVDAFEQLFYRASRYTYGERINENLVFFPRKGAGLYALLVMFVPGSLAAARSVFIAALLGAVVTIRRIVCKKVDSAAQFDYAFAVLVSLSLLFSLWMLVYDLTILLLPFALIFSHIWSKTWHLKEWLLGAAALVCYLAFSVPDTHWGPIAFNLSALGLVLWNAALLVCWPPRGDEAGA